MLQRAYPSVLAALVATACTISFPAGHVDDTADGAADGDGGRPRPDAGRSIPDGGWADGPVDWAPLPTRTEPLRFEAESSPTEVVVFEVATVWFVTNALNHERVDFEVTGVPHFGRHFGYGVDLTPEPGDEGDYLLEVTARVGDETASTVLHFSVLSEEDARGGVNVGPMWLPQPDLEELYPPYDLRGTWAWPIVPTATVDASVCDEEGHDITLEIEVVPAGQPLREVATHRATLTPVPYYGSGDLCAEFTIPLTGLADGRYTFWAHAVDELGATDPYGWVEFRSFELRAE